MNNDKNIIEVKNLFKTFGDVHAVEDISFTVPAGKIFAFLGPNGAGKTTTIKMLTTLLPITKGKIILNGFDVEKQPEETGILNSKVCGLPLSGCG